MRFRKRKWWYFVFIIIILIFFNYCLSIFAKSYISLQRQEIYRIKEAEEQATLSQIRVCTKDGRSLPFQENSSFYIIPKDMERIFICGTLEISTPSLIAIYLSQNGEAFTSTSAVLKKGPFIMDMISTSALKGGKYRADVYIVREKSAASVSFLVVK